MVEYYNLCNWERKIEKRLEEEKGREEELKGNLGS